MVIDAHQHFWEYDSSIHDWISDDMQTLKRDFMPPTLKRRMNREDIDGCVAIQADQTEQETEFLLHLAEKYDFIKGVVGWLDLQANDIEEKLNQYHQNRWLKGLRHTVQDEPDDRFLLRPDFLRGMKMLQSFDLTYDILIYARHLPVAIEFASKFPNQKFVVNHIAKPDIKHGKIDEWKNGICILSDHPNMYCKVSGMVTEANWGNWKSSDFTPYLDVIFEAFGPERIMFGSDWPVCTLAASYGQVLHILKEYIQYYSHGKRKKIMRENAQEFYDI
jgi:L-fuconolactonase